MKRCFLLLSIAILSAASATAQILGAGTLTDPYHGITTTDFTITGTKYFNANIGASSGILTISPGARVVSVSLTACITITGTGRLVANGTSASTILFTTDYNENGIFGETSEYWGDIFITSSGVSSLNYCIIERGQRLGSKIASFGGGMYIGGSGSVTINHCTFRFCTAFKGGGICIASGAAPQISNTLFTSNTANDHGGAIYVSTTSAPVISSCIFRSNNSTSATLPGGTIASVSGAPKIINSDITYSTSSTSEGKSVYLENSSNSVIVNTIIWGGTNHISLNGTPSSVFNTCAIEGVSYSGCINLSSINNDPEGPNFVKPTTGNYSITFASPCLDSGLDSYAGITIPATDYSGSARVGITDIGAYEHRYSRWNGMTSADWSVLTNWDGGYSPGLTRNIIIPAGLTTYPTQSPGPNFTLLAGLKMFIQPGAKVTFNSLTNNGTIYVQSDATGIASMMTNTYTGTAGSLNVDLFFTGGSPGPGLYRWHYIASPVSSSTSVFTSINPYNLLGYDESKVTESIEEGWQWHDGYEGDTGFSTLEPKNGYNVFNNTDATISFTGLTSLTTSMGQIDLPFSGSGGDTSLFGYSLIGNSLTCGLNWDLVTRSNTEYVRNAIYITTNDNVASYVNGVGTNGGTAHIPPLQGFFVKTRASGTYITIGDNAKEHNSTVRFKSEEAIPLVRLELSSENLKDESVIRLDQQGTLNFDNEYDAGKMFGPVNSMPMIYTVIRGEEYSINTVPWPENQTVIPITIQIPKEGTYRIKCTDLQELGTVRATLTDFSTGIITDLSSASDYSFTSANGKFDSRFVINLYAGSSAIKEQTSDDNSIKVYSSYGKIIVEPLGEEWNGVIGEVRIYDISGKLLFNGSKGWFYSGETKEFNPSISSGVFIVEIKSGNKQFIKRIVLTR